MKHMREKELWDYLWTKKAFHTKPLGRDFLWVHKSDFGSVERYFVSEFNIFHKSGESMRSRGYFKHIHAVHQGDHVFIHQDTGNIARFFPLGIVHLFADVLPFLLFEWRSHIPKEHLYYRPQQKPD